MSSGGMNGSAAPSPIDKVDSTLRPKSFKDGGGVTTEEVSFVKPETPTAMEKPKLQGGEGLGGINTADSTLRPESYEGGHITIEEVSFVKPETPTAMEKLKLQEEEAEGGVKLMYLSSLDLYWREFFYNRRVLFYKLDGAEAQAAMVAKMRRSLEQVLVWFYPLAGRLAAGGPAGRGRVGLHCGDQGVEFVEASCSSPLAFSEMESMGFQPCPFFNKLARWPSHDLSKLFGLPLLSIQVTKFQCGSVAVGYAHSHVIADGNSMWQFMNAWAEVARGGAISVQPIHDRTPLRVESPSEDVAAGLNLPQPRAGANEVGPLVAKEPLVEKLFHISPAMIGRLKAEAGQLSAGGRPFSTYEVICAHWWRSVMRARAPSDGEPVRFAVLADMRARVEPPLPAAYFGNAIMFTFANSTFGELRRAGLASLAGLIHQASKECDYARLLAKMHYLELHGNLFGSRTHWDGSCMNVASSPKFKVYDVDFGCGRPLAVRCAHVNGDGEMVLFPGRSDGIDICMPLTKPAMDRLPQDPNFLPV